MLPGGAGSAAAGRSVGTGSRSVCWGQQVYTVQADREAKREIERDRERWKNRERRKQGGRDEKMERER